jgi:hypothetical protein
MPASSAGLKTIPHPQATVMPLADLIVIAEDEAWHNPWREIFLDFLDWLRESRINIGGPRAKNFAREHDFARKISSHPQIPHNSHTLSTKGAHSCLPLSH